MKITCSVDLATRRGGPLSNLWVPGVETQNVK